MRVAKSVILFAAVATTGIAAPLEAADSPVLWHNNWYVSTPLTLNGHDPSAPRPDSGRIAFAPDRDVLLTAPSAHTLRSNHDYHQIVRLRPDGTVRWTSNVGGYGGDGSTIALLPKADGSATVLLHRPGSLKMVVRLDAIGKVVWRRLLGGGTLESVSPSRLAMAGCDGVTVLDESNGNVVWQRVLGPDVCTHAGLQVDGEGNLYALSGFRRNGLLHYRITKFDASGNAIWHQERSGELLQGLAGIGRSMVYLLRQDENQLQALRTSDGSVAWSAPLSSMVMGGSPYPEPIAIRAQSIARLNSETGQPRWTTPISHARMVDVVADSLLVESANGRQRIDLASGAILWDVSDGASSVAWLAFGDLNENTVRAFGRSYSLDFAAEPYFDHRIDFTSGQIVSQLPAIEVAQGLDAVAVTDTDGDVVQMAVSQQPRYPGLHLRGVDASSGETRWEQFDLLDDLGPEIPVKLQEGRIGTVGDYVAIAVPLSDYSGSPDCGAGGVRVAVHDRHDGAPRWKRLLRDADQRCTEISSPVLDSNGNVFLSVSAKTYCGPGLRGECQRRTLYKLRNHDGAVVWRTDEDVEGLEYGSPSDPKEIHVFGDDAVVMGPFAGEVATLRRHSGLDGSILWSSLEFAGTNEALWKVERIDEGHVIFHGEDVVTDQMSTAKIDTNTGSTLWRAVSLPSPAPACEPYWACGIQSNALVLPGGNVLYGLQLNWYPWLALARNDGSGVIDRWQAASGTALLDSAITRIVRDPSNLRAILRRANRAGTMSLLSTINPTTGHLVGQQALHGDTRDLIESENLYGSLALPAVNRLLASARVNGSPDPPSMGVALLDASVRARGNLEVAVAIEATVSPGDSVPFIASAAYEGDHPVEGVRLFVRLPWQSGIRNATCTMQAASNCELDLRFGHVHARFDVPPGGSVTVRGEALVLAAGESQRFDAMVTGPIGLEEADSIDNFHHVDILQSQFRNGFEPAH